MHLFLFSHHCIVLSFNATFSSFSLVEHAFLLRVNRSCVKMADRVHSQIIKKQTRWSSDKTVIELGYIGKYRDLSVSRMQINNIIVIYSPLTNHGAPSRPIIVNDVCVAMTTNRRCPQDTTMEYTYYPTASSQQLKMRSFRFFNDYDVVYFHCELLACYRYSYNSRYVCCEEV